MINLTQAAKINKDVRGAFRQGGKSGNKAYTDALGTEIDAVPMTAVIEPKGTGNLNKTDLRNNNAAVGSMFVDDVRRQSLINVSVKNALDYGEILWFMKAVTLCGNCTEMACMAAYLVNEEDPSSQIRIVSTDGPGDHVFCAVGPGTGWKVNMNIVDILDQDRKMIIIDPWANTCSLATDYMEAFEAKMGKWALGGKRIADGGSSWVVPDASYIAKFRASKANFCDAKTGMPSIG